jgi:hypothetical protein
VRHGFRVEPDLECHVRLGDTYYSRVQDDCRRRFLGLWPVASEPGRPCWTPTGDGVWQRPRMLRRAARGAAVGQAASLRLLSSRQ